MSSNKWDQPKIDHIADLTLYLMTIYHIQYPHGRVPPVIGFQNLTKTGGMDPIFNTIQEEFCIFSPIFEVFNTP